MSDYEVVVLKPGYAEWTGTAEQRADGTITLIKGPNNIVVDTGGIVNRNRIPKLLRAHGLQPADINYVVCTHGHPDHCGNNNLFQEATIIFGNDVVKGDLFSLHHMEKGQSYDIDDDVRVVPTPGHTYDDCSVVVKTNDGVYVIAGDIFENKHDQQDPNLWRSFSCNKDLQEQSRQKILKMADYIVPGHGDVFAARASRPLPARSAVDNQTPPKVEERPSDDGVKGIKTRLMWSIVVPLVLAIISGVIVFNLTH